MLVSKAQLMTQTINSGTTDQVKEQLALLSQFKDSDVKVRNCINGQEGADYDQITHDLLLELLFMKKCHICSGHSSKVSNLANSPMTNGNK